MKTKKIVKLAAIVLLIMASLAVLSNKAADFDESQWKKIVESQSGASGEGKHFDGKKYFNPWIDVEQKTFLSVLKWKLSSHETFTAEEKQYLPTVQPIDAAFIDSHDNFAVWLGHNSVLVKLQGTVLLSDPVFGEIPFVKKRVTPSALSYDEAGKITSPLFVLITHNHYDHLDRKSIESLPPQTQFVIPKGLTDTVRDFGRKNIIEMDWWNSISVDGVQVHFLPSQHWSKRTLLDTNRSLWGSYLVESGRDRIFLGGDSGYFKGFAEIGKRFPGITLAFISTGAYRPRWFMHQFHQDAQEARAAASDIHAALFIPVHWGAFRLGDDPPGFPAIELSRLYPNDAGMKISHPGEVLFLQRQ